MVGVARDAGDGVGVARLHGARGAAQRHDAAGAAHRNMIEPAQREAEMLGQADRRVRRQREARHAQPVEPVLGKTGAFREFGKRAGKKPVRATDRVAHIRHGHRGGDDDVVIGGACAAHTEIVYQT